MKPSLFAMPDSVSLAEQIAQPHHLEIGRFETHTFPDGETLFQIIDPVSGKDVCLVARLDHPNPKIFPVLMLAEGLVQQGARSVTLIAPYLPYMRQDIAFRPGEVITAKVFAKLVSQTFDRMITIEPHLHRFHDLNDVYDVDSHNLSAAKPMAKWIANRTDQPLIIGPDEESAQWVSKIADQLGAPFLTLRKQRHGDRDVDISMPVLDTEESRTIVLVDDIVSSGTTLLRAAQMIHKARPGSEIISCIVHCLATPETIAAINDAGVSAIAATDTVVNPIGKIRMAGLIAEKIEAI